MWLRADWPTQISYNYCTSIRINSLVDAGSIIRNIPIQCGIRHKLQRRQQYLPRQINMYSIGQALHSSNTNISKRQQTMYILWQPRNTIKYLVFETKNNLKLDHSSTQDASRGDNSDKDKEVCTAQPDFHMFNLFRCLTPYPSR